MEYALSIIAIACFVLGIMALFVRPQYKGLTMAFLLWAAAMFSLLTVDFHEKLWSNERKEANDCTNDAH